MAGLKIQYHNFFDLIGRVKEVDIIRMPFQDYINELYHLTRRLNGFKIVLSELAENPERLKGYRQRAAFIDMAQIEREAGTLLLTMFESDPRYAMAIIEVKKLAEQNKFTNPNTWEDFISFWEQRS